MSMTEREKEIALERLKKQVGFKPNWVEWSEDDIVEFADAFLSGIREEQEPVGYRIDPPHGLISFTKDKKTAEALNASPVFTTPPAPLPNGNRSECKDLEMIKRMMATGTADSFMSLDDEQKRMAFAVGVHESTLRKKLNDSCEELVEALEIVNLFCCRDDAYTGGWVNYSNKPEISPQDIVVKALANHAKRMKV